MAQSIKIDLKPRKVIGKHVKKLRNDGIIPAVIHDHGKKSVLVQGNNIEFIKLWREAGKHHPVELVTDKKNYTALIKDIKFGPKKHDLQHIVFNAVDRDQKVEANIPLKPKYAEDNDSSPAERTGLIVLNQLDSVEVRALASKLPDVLEYDAEKLVEIGDHIAVKDLDIPGDIEVLTELDHSIATVYEPSALAAANDAAGGTAELSEEESTEEETDETSTENQDSEKDEKGTDTEKSSPEENKS